MIMGIYEKLKWECEGILSSRIKDVGNCICAKFECIIFVK